LHKQSLCENLFNPCKQWVCYNDAWLLTKDYSVQG
jgi:hypothetical protein